MNVFIQKTLSVAKKSLSKVKDTHSIDIYLRLRRFMFRKKWPGNTDIFDSAVEKAFTTS